MIFADLIGIVVRHVPVRGLRRFATVCKKWNSISKAEMKRRAVELEGKKYFKKVSEVVANRLGKKSDKYTVTFSTRMAFSTVSDSKQKLLSLLRVGDPKQSFGMVSGAGSTLLCLKRKGLLEIYIERAGIYKHISSSPLRCGEYEVSWIGIGYFVEYNGIFANFSEDSYDFYTASVYPYEISKIDILAKGFCVATIEKPSAFRPSVIEKKFVLVFLIENCLCVRSIKKNAEYEIGDGILYRLEGRYRLPFRLDRVLAPVAFHRENKIVFMI